jgi:hypothetical protein
MATATRTMVQVGRALVFFDRGRHLDFGEGRDDR